MHRIKFCIYRWCTYQVPAFKAEFHFFLINLITQRTRFQVSHEYLTALLEGGVGDRGEGLMAFHSTHARCCRTWENVRRWGFRHPCVSDVSFRQFAWKWVWSIGRETRLRCSSHCWESVWLNLPSSFWEESLPMTSLLTSLTSYRFWRLAEGWYSKNSCQKVAHSRACMNKTSHYYIFLWNIFLYRYTRSNQCNPIHVSQSPTTFKHPLTHDNRIAAPYQSYSPAEIVRG